MEEKIYKFILPDENNQIKWNETKQHSLIIIGANGAGKSQLGAWMEKTSPSTIHRIGAQRSLSFGKYIKQMSYEQATNLVLYGYDRRSDDHNHRWAWDGEQYDYTSSLLDDYENVLSALLAQKCDEQDKYINDCKTKDALGQSHDCVPEMVTDKLQRIWKNVFPHRNIEIKDGKVIASLEKDGTNVEYKGKSMSDGERVGLYLISQALCVPKNKTIIIDEPEIHLHRSIMNRLWDAIEKERKDCFFIYITHDTQFAANHKDSEKFWVKNFDGNKWDLEKVSSGELPEQLLLDILGNRKTVLFVEGTWDSYDTKLYSQIYNNYYIVPCGSCTSVISRTKAMKSNEQLHDFKCFGIIDRDFRSDYEIEAYKSDDVYTLKVAEVENLFLVEGVLEAVNRIMGFMDNSRVDNVINYIIETRFAGQINSQVCEAVVAELKYHLSIASISKKNEEEARSTLNNLIESIKYDTVKSEQENKFNSVLENKVYDDVLKVFNCKSLSTSIGHFFDMDNKAYRDFVLRQINGIHSQEIINALIPYLPTEIPV